MPKINFNTPAPTRSYLLWLAVPVSGARRLVPLPQHFLTLLAQLGHAGRAQLGHQVLVRIEPQQQIDQLQPLPVQSLVRVPAPAAISQRWVIAV